MIDGKYLGTWFVFVLYIFYLPIYILKYGSHKIKKILEQTSLFFRFPKVANYKCRFKTISDNFWQITYINVILKTTMDSKFELQNMSKSYLLNSICFLFFWFYKKKLICWKLLSYKTNTLKPLNLHANIFQTYHSPIWH